MSVARNFDSVLADFQRDAAGLQTVDCSGITLGNDDLEGSCVWTPTVVPVTPDYQLPGHEHTTALSARTWRDDA